MSMLNLLKTFYEMVARTKCTKTLVIYLKEFEKNESKAGDAELSIDNLTFTFTFGCTTKYTKKYVFYSISIQQRLPYIQISKRNNKI